MKTIIGVLIAMCVCLSWAHEEHEHDHDAQAHGHADEHGHGEERGVEVSEAASKLIGLTTVRAEQRVLDSIVTVPARVVENPKAARTISARIGGFVTYTAAAPQAVAPDERLFEFVSPEAAAQHGELKALESRLEQLTTAGAKNAQLKTDLSIARITYAAGKLALNEGVNILRIGVYKQFTGDDIVSDGGKPGENTFTVLF